MTLGKDCTSSASRGGWFLTQASPEGWGWKDRVRSFTWRCFRSTEATPRLCTEGGDHGLPSWKVPEAPWSARPRSASAGALVPTLLSQPQEPRGPQASSGEAQLTSTTCRRRSPLD